MGLRRSERSYKVSDEVHTQTCGPILSEKAGNPIEIFHNLITSMEQFSKKTNPK